jgi:hypothetical protein
LLYDGFSREFTTKPQEKNRDLLNVNYSTLSVYDKSGKELLLNPQRHPSASRISSASQRSSFRVQGNSVNQSETPVALRETLNRMPY